MGCELCGLDLLFYGQASRSVEGVNICLGCYLEIHESGYGAPTYRECSFRFITRELRDTRLEVRQS